MCLLDDGTADETDEFRRVYQKLDNALSFEFHQILEQLKNTYASVDPDADTRTVNTTPCSKSEQSTPESFADQLKSLLQQANYEPISRDDINQALKESSLFKIRLHVDLDDFSEVLLFCRGESVQSETIYRLIRWFPKTITFINFDRVVVYIRTKETAPGLQTENLQYEPDSALLKLFQNVPKDDLEMLFPNTAIRMRTLDKLLIGVPAVISGSIVLTTKVGASLLLLGSLIGFWLGLSDQPVELNKTTSLALIAGFGALAGYLWKQFSSFKNRKIRFMQALTQNLYFKNLDNNAGVFHRLVSDAQDEECKEALLAYHQLLRCNTALSREALDQRIEQWFETQWHCEIDFEIDDALKKLIKFGLIKEESGLFSAVSVPTAIERLDDRWKHYSQNNSAR